MIFFTFILIDKESACHRFSFFETIFIKIHELLFCGHFLDEFDVNLHQIKDNLLDDYIERVTVKFKEQDVFVIIVCIVGLFEYGFLTESGSLKSIFRLVFEEITVDQADVSRRLNDEAFDVNDASSRLFLVSILKILTSLDIQSSQNLIFQASSLVFSCLSIVLRRVEDKNILILIHICLIFLRSLATVEKAMTYIERNIS